MQKGTVYYHDRTEAEGGVLKHLQNGCNPGLYSARALSLSTSEDVVVLHEDLRPHCEWAMYYLRKSGILISNDIHFTKNYPSCGEFEGLEFSPFLFGENAHAFRPNKRRLLATSAMNSKNFIMKICEKLGIAIPYTKCFSNKMKLKLEDVEKINYPVFFKLDESIAGKGVEKCDNVEKLINLINSLDNNTPFQLQEDLPEAITFLNVQYSFVDGSLQKGLITDQVLSGNCHIGNMYPSQYGCEEVWQFCEKIANYAAYIGVEGEFAFDIAVCRNVQGGVYYKLIECNPRYNGSTFPAKVAQRLAIRSSWTMQDVSFEKELKNIDIGSIIYNFNEGRGVIPINWGYASQKKIGLMIIAPDEKEQKSLKDKFLKLAS